MQTAKAFSIVLLLEFSFCVSSVWVTEATRNPDIQVEVRNGSVLIPVSINGRLLRFLVDTGSTQSAIAKPLIAQLNLQYSGTVNAEENYGTQSLQTVRIREIRLAESEFNGHTFAIADLDTVSRAIGVRADGVLGNDLLKTVTFKLSYSRSIATFGSASELGNLGTPIKLREERNQFFVPTTLLSINRDLLLDTGANSTSLSSETWEGLSREWTPKSIIDGVASSANSPASASLVCLPNINLGKVEIKDQAVRVQRPVSTGAFSEAGFSGILGSDLLRRFEVTFDLSHSMLFVKPDPAFRPDPYQYVTVGIQFAKDASGVFTVISVWKNSPAAEVGMVPGDRIIGIDGMNAGNLTLEQFSGKIHAKAGTLISLKIDREDGSSIVTLRTRKLLC